MNYSYVIFQDNLKLYEDIFKEIEDDSKWFN